MATVAERLPDEQQEIAHENPAAVVWRLAWPAVALNSLQVVNNLLDRGFIGHLSTPSLTAHGGATNIMFLMFSLALAVATGSTAIVARAFGAENHAEVRHASKQSLSIAIAFGIFLGLVTSFGAGLFSVFLLRREDQAAIHEMTRFLVAYGLGLPALTVIQTLAGSLRGVGDTKSPMVISGVQVILHVMLDFVLIFPTRQIGGITVPGAGMGLAGGATALSSTTTLCAIVYVAYAYRTPLGKLWPVGLPEWSYVMRILRIAVPASMQAVLRVLSLTTFTLILALVPNGSVAVAAMSVGFAIESIMIMPSFGLSAAAGALVGQSLGMKRPDRAEKLGWTAAHHAALVTLLLAAPIYVLAPTIAGVLLDHKPDVVAQAISLLRYLCLTEVFFVYAVTMQGAMQGAGDTIRPLWIVIFSLWGMRVPLAFFMAVKAGHPIGAGMVAPIGLGMGATGAWMAMAMTQGVQGVLSLIAFKQGAWKHRRV